MYIEIQGGGGGKYANTGTSFGIVDYLKHEDENRIEQKKDVEPFFNALQDNVEASVVIEKLDNNKGQLGKKDAKFFVITVNPSIEEQKAMGRTEKERSANFKNYINNVVMQQYAEGFGKGHNAKDLMYYAKIHHTRKNSDNQEMHAHIVVSRKDLANKVKMSPQTNHKNAETSGNVNGGFDRTKFYIDCEKGFDVLFYYKRNYEDSFEYQNARKNGTEKERERVSQKKIEDEQHKAKEKYENDKRIKQLRMILKKYSKEMSPAELKSFLRSKFGVDLVFHYSEDKSKPSSYSIIDFSKNKTYKGEDVFELDKILKGEKFEEKKSDKIKKGNRSGDDKGSQTVIRGREKSSYFFGDVANDVLSFLDSLDSYDFGEEEVDKKNKKRGRKNK